MNFVGLTKESIRSDYSESIKGESVIDLQFLVCGNRELASEFIKKIEEVIDLINERVKLADGGIFDLAELEEKTTMRKQLDKVAKELYDNIDKIEWIETNKVGYHLKDKHIEILVRG